MSEEICVQLKTLEGEIVFIPSHANEKLFELISKINIQNDINSLQIIIDDNIYDVEENYHKTLSEMQINKFSQIFLNRLQSCGSIPLTMDAFNFNSLDTKIKLELSKSNYCIWRVVREGISFIGICNSVSCEAYNQYAYYTLGFGKFDIRNTLKNLVVCPICKQQMVSVENFGFHMAQWKIKGITIEGKKVKIVDKTNEKGYYTTFKEGTPAQWQYIEVNVKQLDKPEFVLKRPKV